MENMDMNVKSFVGVTCTFLVSVSFNTSAELIDNGFYTTDTETGLDWLDLTQSTNRSWSDVTSQFSVGGDFEGWRYAQLGEVITLYDHAGATGPYGPYTSPAVIDGTIVQSLLDLWGATNGPYESEFITGQLAPFPSLAFEWGSFGFWLGNLDQPYMESWHLSSNAISEAYERRGSALVRNSAVPVPAAVWLFGSGILGLIGLARRKAA